MKRLSSQLTYANVIATLCLFLLVGGGTAFAATQLGKDSVGSKQLKKNSVIASKIKNGTITGSKIRLSTLGAVPSATTASHAASADSALKAVDAMNAETLGGQSAGQLAGASRLHCPSGMALFGGLCYQEQTNAPAEMGEAVIGCARAGLRLPIIALEGDPPSSSADVQPEEDPVAPKARRFPAFGNRQLGKLIIDRSRKLRLEAVPDHDPR